MDCCRSGNISIMDPVEAIRSADYEWERWFLRSVTFSTSYGSLVSS